MHSVAEFQKTRAKAKTITFPNTPLAAKSIAAPPPPSRSLEILLLKKLSSEIFLNAFNNLHQ
jgi:hypothetical protein